MSKVLDLEYILDNTVYVVKFTCGRTTCTRNELDKYQNMSNVRDIDRVCTKGQPKELQEFYNAYEYANYELGLGLFEVSDFYAEWIKDPDKFKAKFDRSMVIGNLLDILADYKYDEDIIIRNYNNQVVGNHRRRSYTEALEKLKVNFDVIKIYNSYGYVAIDIQEDDVDIVDLFGREANSIAISHSLLGHLYSAE